MDSVVLSWGRWGAGWNIPEVLASACARVGGRVLYVEKPALQAGRWNRSRPWLEELEPKFFVLHPWPVPNRLADLPIVEEGYHRLLARQVRQACRCLQFDRPALLVASSLLSPVRTYDFLEGVKMGIAGDWWSPYEAAMARRCHALLAISHCMYQQCRQLWPEKTFYLPYGSDYTGIQRIVGQNGHVVPSELASLKRPIIGYLGPIAPRVDQTLLIQLARRRPQWSIVCIGGWATYPGFHIDPRLLTLPNLTIVGWQPFERLPLFVHAFDVAILPYRLADGQVYHCNPQKLWEYLALGKPIVSTPILEVERLVPLVYLGTTVEEFEAAIHSALREPSDDPIRDERRALARTHSLEAIGATLADVWQRTVHA